MMAGVVDIKVTQIREHYHLVFQGGVFGLETTLTRDSFRELIEFLNNELNETERNRYGTD